MKTKALIFTFLGMLAIFFAACTEDEPIVAVGINLDMDSLSVALESTCLLGNNSRD